MYFGYGFYTEAIVSISHMDGLPVEQADTDSKEILVDICQIRNIVGILEMCIRDRKNAQRMLSIEREHSISADKLKSAFIANMSHEVRTPLNAIVGFSGLMVSASSEEERKMYADVIAENNERLLRLVNDIFDLSQIESGTVDFVYTEFDANDLLRELEGIFKTKLNNSSVELVCEAHIQPIICLLYTSRCV